MWLLLTGSDPILILEYFAMLISDDEEPYFHNWETAHKREFSILPEVREVTMFIDGLEEAVQRKFRVHIRSIQNTSIMEVMK